ncbi:hypothetical protein ACP2W0_17920 [Pseudobacillus badius]|uniref:hypothetical protein n=1 Tax=Bacillus badius TaxID=1455 RepID=UPI003CF25FB7
MENLLKSCLGCLGLFILLSLVIGGCTSYFSIKEYDKTNVSVSEKAGEETSNHEADEAVSKEKGNWQSKIQEVAASSKTKTEKLNEVSFYAQGYKASGSERTEFENHIVNEYKTGKYLADIENDEYMLTNLFKARVVDTHYNHQGQKNTPIALFALDFWQNTKYTYQRILDADSHEVQANEEQMDKALAKR